MLGYVVNAENAETCFGAQHVLAFHTRSTSMPFNLYWLVDSIHYVNYVCWLIWMLRLGPFAFSLLLSNLSHTMHVWRCRLVQPQVICSCPTCRVSKTLFPHFLKHSLSFMQTSMENKKYIKKIHVTTIYQITVSLHDYQTSQNISPKKKTWTWTSAERWLLKAFRLAFRVAASHWKHWWVPYLGLRLW